MKKILVLFLLLFCISITITSCTKKEPRETDSAIQLILKSYYLDEPNPSYKDQAKELNDLFRYALINRNKIDTGEQKTVYAKAKTLCKKDDDEEAVEDAVDERRIMLKESICMSTVALVTPSKEALKYYNDARNALASGADRTAHELLEEEYAATVLLELLYLSEHNMIKSKNRESSVTAINKLSNISVKDREPFIEVIRNL